MLFCLSAAVSFWGLIVAVRVIEFAQMEQMIRFRLLYLLTHHHGQNRGLGWVKTTEQNWPRVYLEIRKRVKNLKKERWSLVTKKKIENRTTWQVGFCFIEGSKEIVFASKGSWKYKLQAWNSIQIIDTGNEKKSMDQKRWPSYRLNSPNIWIRD